MKCPLLSMCDHERQGTVVTVALDCLKEECAWWDGTLECCLIRSIVCEFFAIAELLAEVKAKMPHAQQFVK